MANVGQIINGKYKILRLINNGGMSSVFLARDVHLSKKWAVKVIPKAINGKENYPAVKAAAIEAQMIKSLNHSAIVRIVDIVEDEESVFIIEDFVNGITLKDYASREGNIELSMLISFAVQIGRILEYLHDREPPIIYRDVKPENFIVCPDGSVKIVDFGTARRYKPGKRSDTRYLGTEQYAAPEQYEANGRQSDQRTDIFGLGKTIKYLTKFVKTKSLKLNKIIEKCTYQNPDKRYQKISELIHDLESLEQPVSSQDRKKGVSLGRILLVVAAVIIGVSAIFVLFAKKKNYKTELENVFVYIDEIKQDGKFALEEEEVLLKLLINIDPYENIEQYDELAFRIGKLYWFYYFNEDGNAGKIKSAQWFSKVADVNDLALVYKNLAEFYRDNNSYQIENVDGGMYVSLVENLRKFIEKDLEEQDDSLKLESYKLAMNLMETFARKIKADGVEYESLMELYNLLTEKITNVYAETEEEELIQQGLIERFAAVEQTINMAYQKEIEQKNKEEKDEK